MPNPKTTTPVLDAVNYATKSKPTGRTYQQALNWQIFQREKRDNFVKKVWWDGDYLALETYGGEIVHMNHDFDPNKPHEVRRA